eukprot:scaffold68316_cov59-Phaeocystis_antarctica.AAC.6
MPQLICWARSPMRWQALDTALVAPATGSTHPLSDRALGMSVERPCAARGAAARADAQMFDASRCRPDLERPRLFAYVRQT